MYMNFNDILEKKSVGPFFEISEPSRIWRRSQFYSFVYVETWILVKTDKLEKIKSKALQKPKLTKLN